jgi:tRNA (guanine26-N2/guanine27-N2)-dimethyltransferase
LLPKLTLVLEGATSLYVPEKSLGSKEPPTYPAFFNPAARVNRDVSVAMARVTRPATFLDALAGVGARGVRIAREACESVDVTLVEFNRVSLQIARKNARRNDVYARCTLVHEESNAFLHSRFGRLERFDAVDIDPFGTPAPYVQGGLSAASEGAIVSITATDTATLCGVFPTAALRRYGASIHKTEFAHEAGIRVLAGFCSRVGGTLDIGVEPVAAHSTLHYMRVYLRVSRGAERSDECLKELGYVIACQSCHEDSVSRVFSSRCPGCGADAKCVGPMWTGKLIDEKLVSKAVAECEEAGFKEAGGTLSDTLGMGSLPPFSYSMAATTAREKVSSVRFQRVVDSLRAMGRSAMREPFGPPGLKTDATYGEVSRAVAESKC